MRRVALLLLVVATAVTTARAQAPIAGTAYSIDFGAITAFDDATIQLGFRAAPAGPNRTGADILLATFPDALIHGFILFALDVDATYGARLNDHLTLFPRVGGSGIVGGGGGGAGGAYGYNVGVGLLGRATPTLGARVDYTWHKFINGDGGSVPISSVTIGFVWMH